MPFGWSGAAQVCVEYYNRMKEPLPEWVRSSLAAFFDDPAYVVTTTFERFLEGLGIFLKTCIDWGVWLAPWNSSDFVSISSGDSAWTATVVRFSASGTCVPFAR